MRGLDAIGGGKNVRAYDIRIRYLITLIIQHKEKLLRNELFKRDNRFLLTTLL